MPRPFYRWKSFWLGVLVLGFLGWAWAESTGWWTFARWKNLSISHAGAGVCLTTWGKGREYLTVEPWYRGAIHKGDTVWSKARFEKPEGFRCTGTPEQIGEYFVDDSTGMDLVPRSAAAHHFEGVLFADAVGSVSVYLPHWLLILGFLLPWTAFLTLRWRRMRQRFEPGP